MLCRKLPLHVLYRDAVKLKHKRKPHLQSLKRAHHQWWYAASSVVSCFLIRLLKAAVFVHTRSSSDVPLGSAVQPDSPAFQKSMDLYRQTQTGMSLVLVNMCLMFVIVSICSSLQCDRCNL